MCPLLQYLYRDTPRITTGRDDLAAGANNGRRVAHAGTGRQYHTLPQQHSYFPFFSCNQPSKMFTPFTHNSTFGECIYVSHSLSVLSCTTKHRSPSQYGWFLLQKLQDGLLLSSSLRHYPEHLALSHCL
jgi:hypothetical protein